MDKEKKSQDKDQRIARYLVEEKSIAIKSLESDLSFDYNEIIQNQKEFFGGSTTEKILDQERSTKKLRGISDY